jgi:hypothetical protein
MRGGMLVRMVSQKESLTMSVQTSTSPGRQVRLPPRIIYSSVLGGGAAAAAALSLSTSATKSGFSKHSLQSKPRSAIMAFRSFTRFLPISSSLSLSCVPRVGSA